MTAGQLTLDLGHRPALGMDDFLVTPCNREAVAWIDRWPDWPGPALAIHGPPGCGKTHLAHVFRARSAAKLIAPEALGRTEPDGLLGEARVCMLDDAGRVAGGSVGERALLHLYNVVAERQGHLLLAARKPPGRWPVGLPDLRSRLAAMPAVSVGAPDDELIGALLVKLFADRQLRVGQDVVAFLLTRMERSFDAARRMVAAIDETALAERRNITVPLVRDVLRHQDLDS
ncbi:MAG: DNA replication protein [Proteobacteria bacterium]|nr:DNA replication protein [Pseudomonadota bacterium]